MVFLASDPAKVSAPNVVLKATAQKRVSFGVSGFNPLVVIVRFIGRQPIYMLL